MVRFLLDYFKHILKVVDQGLVLFFFHELQSNFLYGLRALSIKLCGFLKILFLEHLVGVDSAFFESTFRVLAVLESLLHTILLFEMLPSVFILVVELCVLKLVLGCYNQ